MASDVESQRLIGNQNAAENVGLENHLTFYGSEPHPQLTRPPSQPPPTAEQLDHILRPHSTPQIGLLSSRDSIYIQTFVLLLSWEETDPKLVVDTEIDRVEDAFTRLYHFKVERWKIPSEDPHLRLNEKILEFVRLGDDEKDCLKIVYYAGHGKLSRNRQPMWTDHRGRSVVWGGIQNVLEQAKSDVLILIDSCSAGTANTDQGRGVTELVAAGGFNTTANGVGPWSFTHALVIELSLLSRGRPFTVSKLHNRIVSRMQNQIPDEGGYHETLGFHPIERYVTPIHVVLTEDHLCISRRIQLLPKFLNLPPHSETLELIQISQSLTDQESLSQPSSEDAVSVLSATSRQAEDLSSRRSSTISSHEVDETSNKHAPEQSAVEQVSLGSIRSLAFETEQSLQKLEDDLGSGLTKTTTGPGSLTSDSGLHEILLQMKTQINRQKLLLNATRSQPTADRLVTSKVDGDGAKCSICKSDLEGSSRQQSYNHRERINLELALLITLMTLLYGAASTHLLLLSSVPHNQDKISRGFVLCFTLFISCFTLILRQALERHLILKNKISKTPRNGKKLQQREVRQPHTSHQHHPLARMHGLVKQRIQSRPWLNLELVTIIALLIWVTMNFVYPWMQYSSQIQTRWSFSSAYEPFIKITMDSNIVELHPEFSYKYPTDTVWSTSQSPDSSLTISKTSTDTATGILPLCIQACIQSAITLCSSTSGGIKGACSCPSFTITTTSCIRFSCAPSFHEHSLDIIGCPEETSNSVDPSTLPAESTKSSLAIPSSASQSIGQKSVVTPTPSRTEASKATTNSVISTNIQPTMTSFSIPSITPAPVQPGISCTDDSNCLGSSVCVYGASTCFLYSYATLGMSCSGDVYDCADPWLCIGGICTTEVPLEMSTATIS